MEIFVFLTERDWSWKGCYGNNTKGVILLLLWCTLVVPSFKDTASIFPEIFFIQYFTIFQLQILWRHHWSNLHNTKMTISLKRKKIFRKEKRHSSVFWKAFQISRKYFSCHIHFNSFLLQFKNSSINMLQTILSRQWLGNNSFTFLASKIFLHHPKNCFSAAFSVLLSVLLQPIFFLLQLVVQPQQLSFLLLIFAVLFRNLCPVMTALRATIAGLMMIF